MKGTLSNFNKDVVPLCDDDISEAELYRSALCTLRRRCPVELCTNRVLGSTPPELSSFECYLSSALLHGYVQVTAGFWIPTTPASLQAWQMFVWTVEWHHTSLNICSSALLTQHNWQLKTYEMTRTLWLIFSSLTTTKEIEELWATTTTADLRCFLHGSCM